MRADVPEKNLHIDSQTTFNKGKTLQWGKNSVFQQTVLHNWQMDIHKELEAYLTPQTKTNMKMNQRSKHES